MRSAQLASKAVLGEQLRVVKHTSQGDVTPQKYLAAYAAHIESHPKRPNFSTEKARKILLVTVGMIFSELTASRQTLVIAWHLVGPRKTCTMVQSPTRLFATSCFGVTEHRHILIAQTSPLEGKGTEENPREDFTSLHKSLHELATSRFPFPSPSRQQFAAPARQGRNQAGSSEMSAAPGSSAALELASSPHHGGRAQTVGPEARPGAAKAWGEEEAAAT